MKKKLVKIFTIIILIITISSQMCVSYATNRYKINYANGEDMIEYDGYNLTTPYVTYEDENGEEIGIAYCIDPDRAGAESYEDYYVVQSEETVTDAVLWRIFANGYPNKTPEEMGCNTKEEAYEATVLAIRHIYSKKYKRQLDMYIALNNSGENAIAAMKNLIEIGLYGEETPTFSYLYIDPVDNFWKTDKIDKAYISKRYKIRNEGVVGKYNVQFDGAHLEGVRITDEENQDKQSFNSEEYFKVLIPVKNIVENGEFNIKVTADLAQFQVYVGNPDFLTRQRYGLIKHQPEDVTGVVSIQYYDEKSRIIINKIDKDTNQRLENATFELLDENKKVLYSGFATDANGKLKIDNLYSGTYYLRETNAPVGYQKLKDDTKIEVKYNQDLIINIKNQKLNNTENVINTGTINITTEFEENINDVENYTQDILLTEKTNINNIKIEENSTQKSDISNKTEEINIQKNNISNKLEDVSTQINDISDKAEEKNIRKTNINNQNKYTNDIENTEYLEEIEDIESKENLFVGKNQISIFSDEKILPKTGM